jgi:hypothetical protein
MLFSKESYVGYSFPGASGAGRVRSRAEFGNFQPRANLASFLKYVYDRYFDGRCGRH